MDRLLFGVKSVSGVYFSRLNFSPVKYTIGKMPNPVAQADDSFSLERSPHRRASGGDRI